MCTKDETAEIIHKEFFRKGGLKDTLLLDINTSMNARIGKWFIGGGAVLLITLVGAWFSLKGQVDRNTDFRQDGYTQDQAALLIQRNEQLQLSLEQLRSSIDNLDDRLRAKGI